MKQSIKQILRPIGKPIVEWYYEQMGHYFPKKLADIHHKREYGKAINWAHPHDINEKINWLKFYSDTSLWPDLADKYKVRRFVEERGLGHLLVNLYGKWDDATHIDWSSLPSQFVLKTNNGSGDVLICKDKSRLDPATIARQYNKLLRKRFGNTMAEPHYNKIEPCIIAEELLDTTHQAFESDSLIDYKIWAFDGKPAYIWVCYNRSKHAVEVGTYDIEWNFHPEYSVSTPHYILSDKPLPRPKSLDQMLLAASVLSKGFPQMRVDLYEVDEKPYFGELTLSSAAGLNYFYTQQFLDILGEKTVLNTANKK